MAGMRETAPKWQPSLLGGSCRGDACLTLTPWGHSPTSHFYSTWSEGRVPSPLDVHLLVAKESMTGTPEVAWPPQCGTRPLANSTCVMSCVMVGKARLLPGLQSSHLRMGVSDHAGERKYQRFHHSGFNAVNLGSIALGLESRRSTSEAT